MELGLSVTEAAEHLALSRVAFLHVQDGKAAISPDLAVRLEQAGMSTAPAWLAMQAIYDLWRAMRHAQPPVRRLAAAGPALIKTSVTASCADIIRPRLPRGWG